ncbi:MAG: hypothetical protein U5L09_10430 [Bacteroidales bacterium]|nr:hypothetical protein [Bacteroidales bacterium]
MKTKQKDIKKRKENIQPQMFEIFEEHYLKREREIEQEKQTLLDKFDLHIKGKNILLENSK